MRRIEFPSMAAVGFCQFVPSPALAGVVQCIWTLGSAAGAADEQRFDERVHPDGRASLIFTFGDGFGIDGAALPSGGFAEALTSRSMCMTVGSRAPTLGVRLHPGGLHALLGIEAHTLVDRLVPLDELSLRATRGLHERLAAPGSDAERAALVDGWCCDRLSAMRALAPAVRLTLDAIFRAQGRVRVRALARAAGLGPRQLERLYREQIGLSPRALARLVRVARARELIRQSLGPRLVEVAQAAGYSDQAHFGHEFKSVTGMTPGEYRAGRVGPSG